MEHGWSLFRVEHKETNELVDVYATSMHMSGFTERSISGWAFFLIYDGYWKWVLADDYRPRVSTFNIDKEKE